MDDQYYMTEALKLAEEALDRGDFPVGALIVGNGEIISTGYRTSSRDESANEVDHAEINALRRLNISPGSDAGKSLPADLTVYSTMEPCLMCFAACILSGVKKVVYAFEDVMGGGTGVSLKNMPPLYAESGIEVVPHVMRMESLILFKRFFSSPSNVYWKDSLLSKYILNLI